MNDKLYSFEDIFIRAQKVDAYMEGQGTMWPFSPDFRYDLVGMFKQLRPSGLWPRAVKLWETDWRRFAGALDEEFGSSAPASIDATFKEWFQQAVTQWAGGWDRIMRPGPACPTLAELQSGPPRPCVVQHIVRLRSGTQLDYLRYIAEQVVPAVAETNAWRVQLWLGDLHGSAARVYIAAPTWDGVTELAGIAPDPDSAWEANVETSLMHA